MIQKIYYLAGIKNKETLEVEIYAGGYGNPNFCKLGNGLGKAYLTEKAARNRLEALSKSYRKIYTDKFFEKNDFVIYRVETKITESEIYTNDEIYFN